MKRKMGRPRINDGRSTASLPARMSPHARDWLVLYARARGLSIARAVGNLLEDAMANTPVVATDSELHDAGDGVAAANTRPNKHPLWHVAVDIDPASRTFFENTAARDNVHLARALGSALENDHIRQLLSPTGNNVL